MINPGGEAVRGGTLRIDMVEAPAGVTGLYFMSSPSNPTAVVTMQIFDQLVEYLPGSLDPQPGLADRWEIGDDGMTYTFHLREAQFSNGMPVSSSDVKYVLDLARGPKSFFAEQYRVISNIETPDDKTVVLHLSAPRPALLYYLGTAAASIVPAKVVEAEGVKAFNERPIGSGAFKLERWTRDQEIVLVRNESYWRQGLPYLDEVRLSFTPDGNTRALNVQSGTVDVADYIPFSQVKTIDKGDSAKVLVAPGGDMNVVWINNSKKPFNETFVRRALNYATPVQSIINVVFAGLAPRMNTIIPKVKYWTDDAKAYPYDPKKARELLAESSVPNGFSVRLNVVGDDQASRQMAQIIQGAWKEIGIEVTIVPLEDATHNEEYTTGKYELSISPPGVFTTDVPVDDQFAELLFASPATHDLFTWYNNPALERLVHEVIVDTDDSRRAKLFAQIHVQSMEDPPVIPLIYTPNRAAVANNVRNFPYLLGGSWRLESVWKMRG